MHNLWLIVCSFLLIGVKIFSTDLSELNEDKPSACNSAKHQKSISFAGGGYFTFTYHAGVIKCLQELFELDDVVFLGDSSGSLAAFVATLSISPETTKKLLLDSMKEKQEASCYGFSRWGEIVTKNALAAVTAHQDGKNAYKRANNRMYVSVTRVLSPLSYRNELINTYHSNEDLAAGMIASLHIPWVFSKNFSIKWRDNHYIDGGFTNNNPKLNENTMCINPFRWRKLDFWLQNGCFTLPTEKEALLAIQLGYEDAMAHQEEFIAHGLKLKNPTVSRVLENTSQSSSATQSEENPGWSIISNVKRLLNLPKSYLKPAITIGFFSKNIILSQAGIHLASAKAWFK